MCHNLYSYFWWHWTKHFFCIPEVHSTNAHRYYSKWSQSHDFSLVHSQWSVPWISKEPLSLSVVELFFIGSLLMHSTNIFDQWCLILFLPIPFASATTKIHSGFSYFSFFLFFYYMFFHICLPSNSHHSCVHFSVFVPSVLYSILLFNFYSRQYPVGHYVEQVLLLCNIWYEHSSCTLKK